MINNYIINNVRCKGCGVCAGGCPTGALSMYINAHGEYHPAVETASCVDCGRCARICPMYDSGSITGEADLIGDYSECFVAHSTRTDIRQRCASGGVTTQILIDLLHAREVDYSITIDFSGTTAPYFKPVICKSADDVLQCRGSKYYPIEFSTVLREIKETPGTCAIVCLPCVATGIRRLQNEDEDFKKIKYIICLTCGHNKTLKYLDFLVEFYGVTPPLNHVSFRDKGNHPFSNFSLEVRGENGKKFSQQFFNGVINNLWSGYYFAQRGCLQCRDIFGVKGDISCMDAWLPPYNKSKNGYNFVMTKPQIVEKTLKCGETITKKTITLGEVIRSQQVIFDRKLSGELPEEYIDNIKASEEYIDRGLSQSFITSRFSNDINTEDSNIRSKIRGLYHNLKQQIKSWNTNYEDLIGR